MKALNAYQDVLRELDAWQSPPVTIRQFNYFMGQAIDSYIAENYERFNVNVKEDDDIGVLVVLSSPLSVSNDTKRVSLPSDYRHFLGMRVKMEFTEKTGRYNTGDSREHYIRRMPSAEKTFRQNNAYGRPSWKNPNYELYGAEPVTCQLTLGPRVKLPAGENAWLDYIKIPPLVYLNPDESSNYNENSNNTELFFNKAPTPTHRYYEIIRVCARLIAFNTRNPRGEQMIQLERAANT
jgi:hypothetical protein